jgi:hypothetical protein
MEQERQRAKEQGRPMLPGIRSRNNGKRGCFWREKGMGSTQIGEHGPARLGGDGDDLGNEAAACALVSETSEGFWASFGVF